MPSQYPVLNNKPIDQWKVIELREELRRRNLITKGLKEELVKRLDEAIQKDVESINLGELGNGDDANSNSQNNTSEEDISLEGADKPTALEEDSNTDKEAFMVNTSHIVFDVIPGHEVQIGNAIEVSALVGKDKEKATITADLEGSAPENQNFTALSGMQVEDAEPQKFEESNSSILGIDEKASSSDLEEIAPVNQNITAHSDTQDEDAEPEEMFEELKPPMVGTYVKEATNIDSKGSAPFDQNATVQSNMQGEDAGPAEKFEESKSLIEESAIIHSCQSNQVSVISQDLEFQVKYKSNSTDSVSINEKNIIKDNFTADHFPLELVAKQEVVQPSSNSYPTGGGDSFMVVDEQEAAKNHATDAQEDLKNQASVGQEVVMNLISGKQETNISYATNGQYIVQIQVPCQQERDEEHASFNDADMQDGSSLEPPKKEDCVELGSPEKLNLDRSSGDESTEEDILDIKHIDADIKSEEPTTKIEAITLDIDIVERTDDVCKSSFEMKDIAVEDIKPAFLTEKRKQEETELVVNNGPPKRHRRWNPDTIKVPEVQTSHVNISTTPKNNLQPTFHHTFSRSNSTISVESPKERIVPTPKKPATTSLRIDNFLRPFTLKAVQELLAKTGHVCDFWMDHIKTHCFVTFSSVEEAIATRNAVYNLQWPSNGGRFLVADFVDPQEVKSRLEAHPPSPAPISSNPATPKAPPSQQKTQAPQPTHQQNLRLQLPPPPPPPAHPPPPPISLSNPLIERERLLPPPKKSEPPVMTLDDLFKKTSATPRIYYLPLTEEQARAKLAAQSKRTQV